MNCGWTLLEMDSTWMMHQDGFTMNLQSKVFVLCSIYNTLMKRLSGLVMSVVWCSHGFKDRESSYDSPVKLHKVLIQSLFCLVILI
jgi:hypothetical protein